MGERGPQPKPTAIRELEGNPSGRPYNKREPKPKKVIDVSPPSWLTEQAKTYWDRVIPILANMGVLTEADLPLLERYCDCLADWKFCREFLLKAGSICYPIYDGDKVHPAGHAQAGQRIVKYMAEFPHVAKKLRFSEHLLKIEMHFGMTPAARSRILTEEFVDASIAASNAAKNQGAKIEIDEDEFAPPDEEIN